MAVHFTARASWVTPVLFDRSHPLGVVSLDSGVSPEPLYVPPLESMKNLSWIDTAVILIQSQLSLLHEVPDFHLVVVGSF